MKTSMLDVQCSAFDVRPPCYPARPVNGGPLDKALPKSGEWDWEPKFNDWRASLHVSSGRMWNRHNQPLTIADEFQQAIRAIQHRSNHLWLDVLALGRRHPIWRGTLVVLDIPGGLIRRDRRAALAELFDEPESLNPKRCKQPLVIIPPLVHGTLETWRDLQAINRLLGCEFYEGLVAKRADSIYPIQLRSPEVEFPFWMKHRWAF